MLFIVLSFLMAIILVRQREINNEEGRNLDNDMSEKVHLFQEETSRMISLTSEEISQYVINGTQFVSFLFYSNKGQDSVMVMPGPIEFYPNYHFLGYSAENDLVMAFGYNRIEKQNINRIKQLVSMEYKIKNDEKDYHDLCLQTSNNSLSCGPVCYKLFKFTIDESINVVP